MNALMDRLVERLRQQGATLTFGARLESLDSSVPTVVATCASAAARLIEPHAPHLGAALASLPMTTISVSIAFFPKRNDDLHGFGVLFPRGCGVEALGVRFDSDIFPADLDPKWRVETWITRVDGSSCRGLDSSQLRRATLYRSDGPDRTHRRASRRRDNLPATGASGVRVSVLDVQSRMADLPPWLALAGNYMGRLGASKLLDVAGRGRHGCAPEPPPEPSNGERHPV